MSNKSRAHDVTTIPCLFDLGCGSGVNAEFLIRQGSSNITCIDTSEGMIDLVKDVWDTVGVTVEVTVYR